MEGADENSEEYNLMQNDHTKEMCVKVCCIKTKKLLNKDSFANLCQKYPFVKETVPLWLENFVHCQLNRYLDLNEGSKDG